MAEREQKIAFENEETGEVTFFYVLDQTELNEKKYLLVVDRMDTDAEEGEDGELIAPCEALILEEKPGDNEEEIIYEVVEDDATLAVISNLFEEEIENLKIEL